MLEFLFCDADFENRNKRKNLLSRSKVEFYMRISANVKIIEK